MRIGRITQTAWNRSVRRQLHTKRSECLYEPSPLENCSGISAGGADAFVWAGGTVCGDSPDAGFYAVMHAAGELAARGVCPTGVSVTVLASPEAEEDVFRDAAAAADEACARIGAQVTAVHGEVLPAVSGIVVTADAAGAVEAAESADAAGAAGSVGNVSAAGRNSAAALSGVQNVQGKPGDGWEILLCGYAGLEGTLRIVDEAGEELGTRFVASFLDQTRALSNQLVTPRQIAAAFPAGSSCPVVRHIGSGGVFAALWDLAEISGIGFEIDMRQIPLRQETVEICEYYRLNPYQLTSAGSYLILTDHAAEVADTLAGAGARAVRLGTARAQNARVISSGEETRYLDRPAPDELVRWLAERQSGSR